MNANLRTTNNWYTINQCEYPLGYYRLTQHAFNKMSITNTVICEGDYSALRQIAQQQQLDCIG